MEESKKETTLDEKAIQDKIQLFEEILKQKPSKEILVKIRENLLGNDDNTFPTFLKKKIQELGLRQLDIAKMWLCGCKDYIQMVFRKRFARYKNNSYSCKSIKCIDSYYYECNF